MNRRAPPWLGRLSTEDPEASRFQQMTPNERLVHFVEACNLATALLQHRSDLSGVLSYRDHLLPTAERTWRRLVTEARHARKAG